MRYNDPVANVRRRLQVGEGVLAGIEGLGRILEARVAERERGRQMSEIEKKQWELWKRKIGMEHGNKKDLIDQEWEWRYKIAQLDKDAATQKAYWSYMSDKEKNFKGISWESTKANYIKELNKGKMDDEMVNWNTIPIQRKLEAVREFLGKVNEGGISTKGTINEWLVPEIQQAYAEVASMNNDGSLTKYFKNNPSDYDTFINLSSIVSRSSQGLSSYIQQGIISPINTGIKQMQVDDSLRDDTINLENELKKSGGLRKTFPFFGSQYVPYDEKSGSTTSSTRSSFGEGIGAGAIGAGAPAPDYSFKKLKFSTPGEKAAMLRVIANDPIKTKTYAQYKELNDKINNKKLDRNMLTPEQKNILVEAEKMRLAALNSINKYYTDNEMQPRYKSLEEFENTFVE